MARGHSDWGKIRKDGMVSSVADLGELAVRLGSINSFDRRGDVYWMDSFEYGVAGWTVVTSPAGGTGVQSADYARHKGYSLKATTPDAEGGVVGIQHYEALAFEGKTGWEIALMSMGDLLYFELMVDILDGDRIWRANVRLDLVGKKWEYEYAGDAWQLIATGVVFSEVETLFNLIKLVIDVTEHEYVRLLFNGDEWPLDGIAMRDVSSTTGVYSRFQPRLTADEAIDCYFDTAIITLNEP